MPLTQASSVPQTLKGKTLSDTFMGKVFDTALTKRNTILEASTDYIAYDVLENSGSYVLEIPATSTLEVGAFYRVGSKQPIYNPCMFSVWRSAAQNTGNAAFAIIACDTKEYDFSNNVVNGVFTATISGYYTFSARFSAGTTRAIIALFKNGIEWKRGNDITTTSSEIGLTVNAPMELAVGDTVDSRAWGATAVAIFVGQSTCYFTGKLESIK